MFVFYLQPLHMHIVCTKHTHYVAVVTYYMSVGTYLVQYCSPVTLIERSSPAWGGFLNSCEGVEVAG